MHAGVEGLLLQTIVWLHLANKQEKHARMHAGRSQLNITSAVVAHIMNFIFGSIILSHD